MRDPGSHFVCLLGYLAGTLPDERSELGHHHVHALQTGSFQFEDLLFHDGLKGQVRGEQPRSERAFREKVSRRRGDREGKRERGKKKEEENY